MLTINEALKKRINQLCEDKGISIYRLSKNSGVPQSTLNEIIQGRSKDPQAGTLNRIAYGFGLKYSEFMNDPIFDEVEQNTAASREEMQELILELQRKKSKKESESNSDKTNNK